ncbi:acetyl-CoA carboxylase biotin carboxyl carrier protein subunit [Cytobacillus kochii]|uniref:acetyl-CoA carboxylase biotin carboxyl carrier protein subunit n=1 Tax=Cytobacillus kochii TaxID=859143 RepID=UPI001CD19985|nr:acetyl-CoA carboxylase biotin carboxyl carrier protein subunit [Cytobacillus kochii]MCA1026665.1 acetyl-CoA carboxylase biotin carboxyl carrier protein subunit [Cytobacillus kochii]
MRIISSVSGTVNRLYVKEGQNVALNSIVAIIESMKMEIPIESNSVGKVIQLKVKIGEFVNEGDEIIELEK